MAGPANHGQDPAGEPRTRLRRALIVIGVLLVLTLPVAYSAVVVPLSPWEQAEVSLALIGFAMLASLSHAMRPLIIFLSCFASARYFYWRVSSTLSLDTVPDATVSVALLGAETYGLVVLFLGYFQTIELRDRLPAPMVRMPTVDVFIPTYNEPVEIVRRTVIGALAIDYPAKRIFVLDDGKRTEIQRMAGDLGAGYKTRPDNRHAKAGNLNHALAETDGELVAIFDADHVPVRGFLRKVVGFFDDRRVALVQTAQHFFNPDPYERNLKLTGRIAPEQTFFYHVVQRGNDFWNAAFFCGSCAVLRRSAVQAMGGIRTDTVTEDAHTALELHARGYRSVYLALPLAAGLATETFAAHVKQRIRWARGMAQILRLDCPLFKRGLTTSQRLTYFNAMLHFFFGIPRLIMIAAPLTYLLLGIHPIKADVLAVLAYILPHIGLSTLGNSIISQSYRHSFWSSVYEVSIAPYTAGVTLLALVNPRLGKFDVTDKGTNLERARFDFSMGRGTLVLLGLSLIGLAVAFPIRLSLLDPGGDPIELHSMLINSVWALANLVGLMATACVAYEQPQQRGAPRVQRQFPCRVRWGEASCSGQTVDMSEQGVRVRFTEPFVVPPRGRLSLSCPHGPGVRLEAERRWCDWGPQGTMEAAFRFVEVDAADHRKVVEMIFSGDDSWLKRTYPIDDPFRSFVYLVSTFWRVTEPRRPCSRRAPRIKGDWPARLDGVPGRCLALSPFGALFEPSERLDGATQASFAIDGPEGRELQARGRLLAVSRDRVAIDFEWPDDDARNEFGRALYATFAATLLPAARRPFWETVRSWARPAGLALALHASVTGCGGGGSADSPPADSPPTVDQVLEETWQAYVRGFVQADGRVIDHKAGGITTSEGQAYAMWRAAWIGDRATFDNAWRWSRSNLVAGVRSDHLMAWKWGRASDGNWRVLDTAFATDGDEDAALALIMAWKRWGDGAYLADARLILEDLWNEGTVMAGGRRFLLAGERLCQGSTCRLNPSYAAPYAYRIFARHDPSRQWSKLVDSAYVLLEANADLTATHLPSDWVLLDRGTGAIRAGSSSDRVYSYDALRVPWRVALDAALFGDARADRYLERSFRWMADEWRRRGSLPAVIGPDGSAQADYEALEMVAAGMPAMRRIQPDVGEAMAQRVRGSLKDGAWGDRESYYLQNWAWFGTAAYEGRLGPLEAVK